MTRKAAIELARAYFDDGTFEADLSRYVAIPTESRNASRTGEMQAYLDLMRSALETMDYRCVLLGDPDSVGQTILAAERIEDPSLPTVLTYGHADVILGQDADWEDGLSPWEVTRRGERIYGRGTADNKGQHTINIAALSCVFQAREKLGFNSRIMIETGEELGSPGLRHLCEEHRDLFTADILIGSDGPRMHRDRPSIVMGTRGLMNFALQVNLREGGHHSGNWGGVLANPAVILANALASIITGQGHVQVVGIHPHFIPDSVRAALQDVQLEAGNDGPEIDENWGAPGLSPTERVLAWNTFEVLAMTAGDPNHPVNAVPPSATAHCQIRYVVGRDPEGFLQALRAHLDERGFEQVEIIPRQNKKPAPATRLDPEHPWAQWAAASVERTIGLRPDVVPNAGGTLPNDVFTETLGMPTLWIPHSYASCAQHAPNEHLLAPLVRQGLEIMTGLYWDLGELEIPLSYGTHRNPTERNLL